MKLRKLSGLIGLLCLLTLPITASAITLDIDYDSGNLTQYSITYNYTDTDGNIVTDIATHYAGSLIGSDLDSDFVTDLYCIESLQSISNSTYDFDVYQLSDTEERFQQAGWLMDTFSYLTGTDDSGVLQLAIWEVTHESDENEFDPYSGDFYVSSGSDEDLALLDEIIASFNSATDEDFASFNMDLFATYTSEDVQDLIGLNPTPTPEPGTMLLFGTGILGMGYLRHRKNQK